jgi:hypothetical protein
MANRCNYNIMVQELKKNALLKKKKINDKNNKKTPMIKIMHYY